MAGCLNNYLQQSDMAMGKTVHIQIPRLVMYSLKASFLWKYDKHSTLASGRTN